MWVVQLGGVVAGFRGVAGTKFAPFPCRRARLMRAAKMKNSILKQAPGVTRAEVHSSYYARKGLAPTSSGMSEMPEHFANSGKQDSCVHESQLEERPPMHCRVQLFLEHSASSPKHAEQRPL
jgi:hypothetical protein